MGRDQKPEYYEKKLKEISSLNVEEIKELINDLDRMLSGLDKGLNLLKKIGKEPEPSVLENQKKFLDIINQFKKSLKT